MAFNQARIQANGTTIFIAIFNYSLLLWDKYSFMEDFERCVQSDNGHRELKMRCKITALQNGRYL